MNRPCSTTPGMWSSAAASSSGIGNDDAFEVEDHVAAVGAQQALARRHPPGAGRLGQAEQLGGADGSAGASARPRTGSSRSAAESGRACATSLLVSAITAMRAEASAMIFSRSSAAPPPLMRRSSGSNSSAPSMVRSMRVELVGIDDADAQLARQPVGGFRGRRADDIQALLHALGQQSSRRSPPSSPCRGRAPCRARPASAPPRPRCVWPGQSWRYRTCRPPVRSLQRHRRKRQQAEGAASRLSSRAFRQSPPARRRTSSA